MADWQAAPPEYKDKVFYLGVMVRGHIRNKPRQMGRYAAAIRVTGYRPSIFTMKAFVQGKVHLPDIGVEGQEWVDMRVQHRYLVPSTGDEKADEAEALRIQETVEKEDPNGYCVTVPLLHLEDNRLVQKSPAEQESPAEVRGLQPAPGSNEGQAAGRSQEEAPPPQKKQRTQREDEGEEEAAQVSMRVARSREGWRDPSRGAQCKGATGVVGFESGKGTLITGREFKWLALTVGEGHLG
jgi:hypothetical protein